MAAFIIALYGRATNTALAVVPDATAYVFEAGTTTPLTVYTSSALSTPRGTSVAADSDGIFPQCWTDRPLVKLDVRDGTGASLPGFPQDNFPAFPSGGFDAADSTFTPVTGNAATDVQGAIAANTTRLNRLDNAAAFIVSGGSGGAYTLTGQYTVSAYALLQEFEFIANHASVGGGSDTLNIDSTGATVIKKYSGSTSKTDLAANDIQTGDLVRVKYDGTHFVMVSFRRSAQTGGTYTATLTPATSGTVTLNASGDTLLWRQIGDLVHVQGVLSVSSISSPVGELRLNLPSGKGITAGSEIEMGLGTAVIAFDQSAGAYEVLAGYHGSGPATNLTVRQPSFTMAAGDSFYLGFQYVTS